MGNLASCCFSSQSSSYTKVLHSSGGLKLVSTPITAAELMLETPGHVVCNIETLAKSCRIIPLKADDELQMNGRYVMVEVNRINCVVSEFEIDIIKNKLRRGCSAKVVPDQNQTQNQTTSGTTEHRIRVRQCWIPALEKIDEVC